MTPSLSYGQPCPCGIAEVATMLRKAKWREVDRKHWPHECVRCGAPAYVAVTPASLDCSDGCV